LSPP
ncbi:membrane-fusion domain protein, partial [Vibrio parahaemolyticus IDH02189]|jgi:hypothetical protein